MQFANLAAHLGTQLGIQVGKRFIKQEYLRLTHNRAPHRHALTLAAGEILRQALQQRLQPQQRRGFIHFLLNFRLRQTRHF